MSALGKDIFKKVKKEDNSEKILLENTLSLIKENIFYSQQLSHTGSWTLDIIKDEIFLSDEIYHIFGCSPEEFDGKLENFYSYVHSDDLDLVKEATQSAFLGKEYDIEYRIVTKDNIVRYIHELTKILRDEKNSPAKVIGTVQDITIHKLIENDLKMIEEDLNKAQRVAGVGSWKYDALKDMMYWSEEVYQIFGVNPLDFKKDFRALLELIHPDDQIKIKMAAKDCLNGKSYTIEFRIPKTEGSEKYVSMKGEPLYNKEQHFAGIIGIIQDITEIKLLGNQLEKNYKSLASAQELAHIGSWEMDIAQKKNIMSEEAFSIYGITKDQYDGTYEGFLKLVHPDDVELIQNVFRNPPRNLPFDMEFRIIRSDGSIRNIYQLVEITFDNNDKPKFIMGTIQDITEKKELEKKLEDVEEAINKLHRRYELYTQDSNDIFEIITADGTIQYISNSIEHIAEYKKENLIGKNILDLFIGKEKLKLLNMLKMVQSTSDKYIKRNIIYVTGDGKDVYYELTMNNLLAEPAVQGITLNWNDITNRMNLEKKLIYSSNHDEITKLPNQFYFRKLIRSLCSESQIKGCQFALFIIDIEGIKYIKDALGYQLSDQLITQIAVRIKNILDNDNHLFRYSEDTFAILLTKQLLLKEYDNFAKKLADIFTTSFKVENYELFASANIGISIFPEDGRDIDSLKKHANIALSKSRDQGKNKYQFYSSNMDINNYKEFELRNDLRKAIEKDQIKIHFQPIVNLQTNEILSAEALIRWEHPTWGLVPPKEFISIAEETGYIIDLGKWMLAEACRNYKKWKDMGLPDIKISLNYSGIQFYEKNFVENIKKIIDEYKLDPSFIIIEFVDSVLLSNFEQVVSNIKSLRKLGVYIALDNFGTGLSSLEYLQQINIDILKIDRSFINNIPLNETSSIITKIIINLGRELRFKIVAEGIETWEQLLYLRNLNCFAGQGFLYSKPIPAEEFTKLLAKKSCKPIRVNNVADVQFEERRKYFRIQFPMMLEAVMSILEISGKKTKIGNTKVLIKNIGAGGLCFISNIRFPVKREIILQFTTQLLDKEIKVFGCPVWSADTEGNLFEYGIEFTFDENDRGNLIGVLNQVQIKLKNNRGFNEGSFITTSVKRYFNS